MFIPIFSGKGIPPKKLSKKELIINYVLLCVYALLGMPIKYFISSDNYPILIFTTSIISFLSLLLFIKTLLSLYRHWKWEADNENQVKEN